MLFNISIIFIGIGLSMDAFSVAISNGLCMGNVRKKDAFKISLFFGIAQGVMPVIGYFGGIIFAESIEKVDHWIAFFFLGIIGIKMIIEAFDKIKNPSGCSFLTLTNKTLFLQAIATSIDALAVGVSFAALNTNIISASLSIAVITFCFCFIGVYIGKRVGNIFKEKAEIFGGTVLVIIGVKILIEHLFL